MTLLYFEKWLEGERIQISSFGKTLFVGIVESTNHERSDKSTSLRYPKEVVWYSVKKLDPINGEKLNCYRASLASLSISALGETQNAYREVFKPF